ncbi:hypothetical protein FACS1894116_08240 [Betaproteobacteria bacterium]|nr:hypothetical protein FACS1894116_08240 [Betaproteobacteria bacterium]GHT98187.1 hypothetical protein FACS1894154_03070 [Betaproteobacteria bacterium]GHU29094.1 hypothetical protein FACS189497_06260 [Betaproteobacteria bacterium]
MLRSLGKPRNAGSDGALLSHVRPYNGISKCYLSANMPPPPFLLSPINDAVFKMIFGDSHDIGHLTNFLKSALTIPPEDYEEVFLPDPHLMRDGWGDKLSILDVKLRTRSGKLVDIEIQLVDQPDLRARATARMPQP